MRDDYVELASRFNRVTLEIRRYGPTPKRCFLQARLSLALGQPEKAIEYAESVLKEKGEEPGVVREALGICARALALEIAILREEAAGAPGLQLTVTLNKGEREKKLKELRRQAVDLLERLPDMDRYETRLLRCLRIGASLDFVQDMVRVPA